jgi:Zinc carboxypeptidase
MHRLLLFLVLSFISVHSFSQLKSPEAFLGYKVGTRFTPHWKIVEYFKHVAASSPSMVKLEQYGQTNEGRPLMIAIVSSPDHISKLENIRQNNLRLASSSDDGEKGSTNAPAIIWLSYNVHGNEASSSEVSMLTLFALVDPMNTQTKQWLQNTVVLIDPCLHPDGRDRYVNWYNSIVGNTYNPLPDAREHQEPWPGGRSNHYNFDLNRDWAWQTQIESKSRIPLYNRWLPQIHVDFHEQRPEGPYYFAPAAEPYHEVITKWQRAFQDTIGRNHARYFDERGWLYYTKQYYDLLYPSYGDTYPIHNGSIGMTYEQAGHGIAGLGIQWQKDGDTLTLSERTLHHYTTSLSTIESGSKNAARLVTEFQKYFTDATTSGVGDYKSYVIKFTENARLRMHSLLDLLQRNGIRYGTAKNADAKGYSYETGKEESFSMSSSDIVIPGIQPKSALVKVLFEPKAALADSFTYDITAWSLPYAYGLKAYATRQNIRPDGAVAKIVVNNPQADVYGYVIKWNGLQSAKLVGQLLLKGLRLRFSEGPFESAGQTFDRGSVIVIRTGNQNVAGLWETVRKMADSNNVQLYPVKTGLVDKGFDFGSNRIRSLNKRKIAMLTGDDVSFTAAGEVWFFFEQILNYPVTLINASDAASINWSQYDVVVLPNGTYSFLTDKAELDQLKNWISNGGHLIAMENAVAQLARQDWSIKSRKPEDADTAGTYAALKLYENREREFLPDNTPGSIFRVELDNTHPLAFGYPKFYYTLKNDTRIYDFFKTGGWNVGVLKKEKQVSGFVGTRLQKHLQDGLLFGVQEIGEGTVTYFADDVLFRSFWENGKLMFANAVFLVGQ